MDMPTYMELEKLKERVKILEDVNENMYLTLMEKGIIPKPKDTEDKKK